jgi:hypothetical protein
MMAIASTNKRGKKFEDAKDAIKDGTAMMGTKMASSRMKWSNRLDMNRPRLVNGSVDQKLANGFISQKFITNVMPFFEASFNLFLRRKNIVSRSATCLYFRNYPVGRLEIA